MIKTFREYLIEKYDLLESYDILDPSRHYKSSSAASPRLILARIQASEEEIEKNKKAGRHDDHHHIEIAERLVHLYGDDYDKSMTAAARKFYEQHGNFSKHITKPNNTTNNSNGDFDIAAAARNSKEHIDHVMKAFRPKLEADVAKLNRVNQSDTTTVTQTPRLTR